jgi:hypothetical protein
LGLPYNAQTGAVQELAASALLQNGQAVGANANDLRQRLENLEKELAAVRAALDKLNETLKTNKGNKPD